MPVVANTFGSTAHISPLLRKTRRLGFVTPDSLLRLAAARGCAHYVPGSASTAGEAADPGRAALSDAELGVAMICGAQDYCPQLVRSAAQLLSGPDIDVKTLVRLARMERCAPLLRYIAEHARQSDEGHEPFWEAVLAGLPRGTAARRGVWPHSSRFMLQSGYQRGGGVPRPVWLRPGGGKTS